MSNNNTLNRLPTLFPTQKEANRALIVALDILKGDNIKKDEQGFCLITDLCQAMINKDASFAYINRNHVIEFFFKDPDHKVIISGEDKIKYKVVRYVKPPKYLYFGTIEKFAPKMKLNGIRSNTKGYIKLYATEKEACEFAGKFARENEKTVALKVDAETAFSEGLKFSTFKDDEYIVVQVNKAYIL